MARTTKKTNRKENNKRTNPRILILCEGETEVNYLNGFKNNCIEKSKRFGLSIEIVKSRNSDLKNLVHDVKKRMSAKQKDATPYNHVWLVFDNDNHPNRDHPFNQKNTIGYEIAFTSIAIEQWFLLHFNYSTKAFENGDSIKRHLASSRNNLIPGYKPGKTDVIPFLKDKQQVALDHARKLRNYQSTNNPQSKIYDLNPYTDMDKLIEFLLNK